MNRLLFLLTFGAIGAAILVALGVWQLQRLEWKQTLLSEIEARIGDAPVALPDMPDPEADKYLAVEVSGEILPGELQVLTSRKQEGPGFRLIAPFETDGGRRILLDRGFVTEAHRADVRRIGPATIIGNLAWPNETDGFTPEPDAATHTWFARDVVKMAQALDTEPLMVVAASETDAGVAPWPVGTTGIPNDHLQYAITWFSLALIWVAMTLYFLWRPRARNTG